MIESGLLAFGIAIAVFLTTALIFWDWNKTKAFPGGAVSVGVMMSFQGHPWYIVIPCAIIGHLVCCAIPARQKV